MARFVSTWVAPVPRGRIGRTDQGVDISAPVGTPIRAIADSRQVGLIPNWYKGQPLIWFEFLKRVGKRLVGTGRYWYVAEQVSIGTRQGDVVRGGQTIGRVAPAGTGLELGYATRTGQTLAAATTGYKEGEVTPAGAAFRRMLMGAAPDAWAPCTLTWYDPALGGTNSGTGRRDPHAKTASGEPYSASAFTCAAPSAYPFGTRITFRYRRRMVTCRVNDRGGAIQGTHFDLSRAAANRLGILSGGIARAEFAVVGSDMAAPSAGITRPGGGGGGDGGSGSSGTDPADAWMAGQFADYHSQFTEQQSPQFVSFWGDVGKFLNPLSPFPFKHRVLPTPAPFKDASDFFKWTAWIFHPHNVLRAVEFVTGLVLMGMGVHTMYEVYRDAPQDSAVARSGRGAKRLFAATPAGRAVRAQRAVRFGRQSERRSIRQKQSREDVKRGALNERARRQRREVKRGERQLKRGKDDLPF